MLSSMTMASISRSARRSPGTQTLHSGMCGGAGRWSEDDDLCAVVLGEHAEGDRDSADQGVEDLLLALRRVRRQVLIDPHAAEQATAGGQSADYTDKVRIVRIRLKRRSQIGYRP